MGLNPSKHEFIDDSGTELSDSQRRFETLSSLQADLNSGLSDEQVEKIIDRSINYFKGSNPYKRWFDQLEHHILCGIDSSYYEKKDISLKACHLDILQWANDPIWGRLSKNEIEPFIKNDIDFLKKQLHHSNIDTLLINGNGVHQIFIREFRSEIIIPIEYQQLCVKSEKCNTWRFKLIFPDKEIRVFSWSKNLQSSRGITNNLKDEIGNWLKNSFDI